MSLSLALLALALPAAALECPDGSRPHFTGHPFLPFDCPTAGKAVSTDRVVLSSAALPSDRDKDKAALKALVGRWDGLAFYRSERYLVLVDLRKHGGDYRGRAEVLDYHTHLKTVFEFDLDGSFWHPGRYGVELRSPTVSGSRISGEAWAGAPGTPSPGFEREIYWRYKGRGELHRLQLHVEPGRIRYLYTHLDPLAGPSRSSGELVPSQREAL